MTQIWRLDCADQTLVLGTEDARLPSVLYWGRLLPDSEDLTALLANQVIDVTGGMLDQNPDLSICPETSRTFPGQPGLMAQDRNGHPIYPQFQFESEERAEYYLALKYRDDEFGLTYEAVFKTHQATGILTAKAKLTSDKDIKVLYLAAPVFPAPQASEEMIDFSGRWCGEFQTNTSAWQAGIRYRDNHTGRTGHEHFPGLIVPCIGATNTQGDVYALHYGWSGGHRMVAEELPDGRRQIQFSHASRLYVEPGKSFETATLYAAFSRKGINGCAVSFQRHVRDEIVDFPKGKQTRPVHYNCWESVYFNHDLETLKDIASRVAVLGAERFVLDDGWFGKRDDDTTSLGDWYIDERKYPDGLQPLIDHIHSEAMTFGIWFEPEMINPESDLYKAHPEWALGRPDQLLGRQQMVLDMANPDVCEYLFECISAVLSKYDIDYIKWDHNRVLPIADIAQTNATYALLDRLREAFPQVEIESCASGGGRVDFGILERTSRVWLSDSNDALERLKIQHNAALFLPASVTGSHVGPRVCHTSGRTLSMAFRAWVAAQRHMGFEMDPRELDEVEYTTLQTVTRWWRDNRGWMLDADILRLDSADKVVLAEEHLSVDGSQFVVFAGKTDTSPQIAPRPLRFTKLEAAAQYRLELANREVMPISALSRGEVALKEGSVVVSGAYLMNHGLNLPWRFPETMWVIEGKKLDG